MRHQFCSKIIGIGWNYAKHAAELGNKVPAAPMFFLKPQSSLLTEGNPIILPKQSANVHHEIELGVMIGKKTKNIREEEALGVVSNYFLALDMTARDLQMKAKQSGSPWALSKGFDTFCPVGELIPADIQNLEDLRLKFYIDGIVKQDGLTKDMVFKIPKLISYLSSVLTLQEGDLILTGTPEGVGKVEANQLLRGELLDNSNGRLLSKFEFLTTNEDAQQTKTKR